MRRPTLDQSNRAFTAAVIGGGGVAGSAVSVLVSGAVLVGLLRLWQGLIALPRDRQVWIIAAAFAARFLAETLSTLVNYTGPWDLYEGMISNLPFLGFVLIFARLSLTPREAVLRWAEYGAVGGGIGAGLFALSQVVILGMPRAEGLAGNSGPFALVCALLFAFCTLAALRNAGPMRQVAVAGAALSAVALLLSGMRSLWPMLLISPLLAVWLLGIRPRRLISASVLLGGLVAAAVLGAIAYPTIERRVAALASDFERVEQGNYNNSLGQRLRVWNAAIELIGQKPVFGHGPGHVADAIHQAARVEGQRDIFFTHAHNVFLNAMLRSGVPGLFAVVCLLAAPLVLTARVRKDATARAGFALLACVTAAYLINGLVNVSFGHDILDAVYISAMVTFTYLVFGPSPGSASDTVADAIGNGTSSRPVAAGSEPR